MIDINRFWVKSNYFNFVDPSMWSGLPAPLTSRVALVNEPVASTVATVAVDTIKGFFFVLFLEIPAAMAYRNNFRRRCRSS